MLKARLAGYFSLLSLAVLASFTPLFDEMGAYVLSLTLLIYTVFMFYRLENNNGVSRAMIVWITSFFMILVVIDPIELGLYGRDPYRSLTHFQHFAIHNPVNFIILHRRPYLYALSSLVRLFTGVSFLSVAKYIPLISTLIPVFIFVIIRNKISDGMAYLGGIFIISTSQYLLIESKFVPEIIAATLFYLSIYIISREEDLSNRGRILLILVSFAIIMSHHFTSFLYLLLISTYVIAWGVWKHAPIFGSESSVHSEFKGVFLISAILFVSVFVFVSTEWMSSLLTMAAAVLSGTISPFESETAAVASAATETWFSLNLSYLQYGFLALFSVFNVAYFFRKYRHRFNYIFCIIGYNGLVSLLFLYFLISGPTIPLHPSRFWVFLVPTLVIAFLVSISNYKTWVISPKRASSIVLILFIVVQLSTMPAHVINTDVGNTSVDEGHYTPGLREGSSWAAEYNAPSVIGWESELWENVTAGSQFFRYGSYAGRQNCQQSLLINRISLPNNALQEVELTPESKVYDSEIVSLHTCRHRRLQAGN